MIFTETQVVVEDIRLNGKYYMAIIDVRDGTNTVGPDPENEQVRQVVIELANGTIRGRVLSTLFITEQELRADAWNEEQRAKIKVADANREHQTRKINALNERIEHLIESRSYIEQRLGKALDEKFKAEDKVFGLTMFLIVAIGISAIYVVLTLTQ